MDSHLMAGHCKRWSASPETLAKSSLFSGFLAPVLDFTLPEALAQSLIETRTSIQALQQLDVTLSYFS